MTNQKKNYKSRHKCNAKMALGQAVGKKNKNKSREIEIETEPRTEKKNLK